MGYIGASSRTLILSNCCSAIVIHLSIKKKNPSNVDSFKKLHQTRYIFKEWNRFVYIPFSSIHLLSPISTNFSTKTQVPIHAIQNIFSLYLYFITLLLKFSFFSLQCGDHHLPPSTYFKIIALKEIANYA